MPLSVKRPHNRFCHRLAALLALGRVTMRVAIDAPGVAIFLHKWGLIVEWLESKSVA